MFRSYKCKESCSIRSQIFKMTIQNVHYVPLPTVEAEQAKRVAFLKEKKTYRISEDLFTSHGLSTFHAS